MEQNVLKIEKRTLMWNIWAQGKNINFFKEKSIKEAL